MKWQRWFAIIVFLLLVVALVVYGFMPRPVWVDAVSVVRAPLQVTVEAEGKTRVKDRYVISAPVAGVARRIKLDVGDDLVEGQIVAWLQPLYSQVLDPRSRAEAEARLAAAEASMQVAEEQAQAARAAADYARADLKRLRLLRTDGMISQSTLDQAATEANRTQAQERSAESAIKVAKFGLEAARSALQFSAAAEVDSNEPTEQVTLKAPVTGKVLKVHQRSQYVVEPGRSLLEIGNPRDLEVEIDVLSADAVNIKPGGRVLFERWGGAVLEGRVRVVEPIGFTKISALGVEEQRVLVIADIVSPREQWARLGDGYRVETRFILWEGDNVLQIPTSALLRHADGWATFVIDADRVRLRQVELGQRSGLISEIVTGLQVGDQVVIHPDDALADGVRIRIR